MTNITWLNGKRIVQDLVPWEKNPRRISDAQLAHLKASIERFNYAAPILVNADGRIIAGHMRCRAMLELGRGLEEVDVRVASRQLDESEFREIALRDNQNGGEWDWDKLAKEDRDLLVSIGFDESELLKNLGLNESGKQTAEPERMDVLAVNPPEAPRLRERAAFHFDSMEDYREACDFFGTGGAVLDHKKLLEVIRALRSAS